MLRVKQQQHCLCSCYLPVCTQANLHLGDSVHQTKGVASMPGQYLGKNQSGWLRPYPRCCTQHILLHMFVRLLVVRNNK
jgi:hypothetical protein